MPPPKFATARDLSAPTMGTRQGEFARVWLRAPFMPAQQLIADVAGELRPNGLPRYPLVLVTEPRQAGKSHLSMAQTGERCFSRPGFRSWYTAQTGGDARDQFLKFSEETLLNTPLARVVRTLRGNGHEVMKYPNGSTLRPHPPTEDAMHGKQSDRNDIDEAWAFSEEEGKQLLQAIAPTQLTRPGAQTFIWSAGGTARSTWLASLVARGRAGDPNIAYFEWGIPDDMALDDLEGIAAHHPAYGYTITLDSIRALRAALEDDAEFARAAGNRWTEVIGGAIPADQWNAARTLDPIPEGVRVGYGAARAMDGTEVAVVAAAVVGGVPVAEVLEVFPAHGAAARVKAWVGSNPVAVPGGPSEVLAADLVALRANVVPVATAGMSAGCATLADALTARAIRFRPHLALDAAVAVAGRRYVADGGWVWARVGSGASVASLEAATIAVRQVTATAPEPALVVRFAKDSAA